MNGLSELDARRAGLLDGELDWARLGDTELVRDLSGVSFDSDPTC